MSSVQQSDVGTGAKKKRRSAANYLDYEQAQAFAHSLNLKSRKEWRDFVKGVKEIAKAKPETIPSHPDGIYKNRGWQGWKQWLGTDKPYVFD